MPNLDTEFEGVMYDIENGEFPVRIATNHTYNSLGVFKNQDIASQVYATAKGLKGTSKLTRRSAEYLRDAYMSVDFLIETAFVTTAEDVDDILEGTEAKYHGGEA